MADRCCARRPPPPSSATTSRSTISASTACGMLRAGRKVRVERHQTLRATIDWSYDLLDETEQAVFARCAVFAGGFRRAVSAARDSGARGGLAMTLEHCAQALVMLGLAHEGTVLTVGVADRLGTSASSDGP